MKCLCGCAGWSRWSLRQRCGPTQNKFAPSWWVRNLVEASTRAMICTSVSSWRWCETRPDMKMNSLGVFQRVWGTSKGNEAGLAAGIPNVAPGGGSHASCQQEWQRCAFLCQKSEQGSRGSGSGCGPGASLPQQVQGGGGGFCNGPHQGPTQTSHTLHTHSLSEKTIDCPTYL